MLLAGALLPGQTESAFGGDDPGPSRESLADAYQRLVFTLNLRPPAWPEVRRDTEVISRELRPVDADLADELTTRVADVIDELTQPPPATPDEDLGVAGIEAAEVDGLPRREGARQVFELSTRAVVKVVRIRLAAIARGDEAHRSIAVSDAEAAFDSLRPYLLTYDAQGLSRLDKCFKGLRAAAFVERGDGKRTVEPGLLSDFAGQIDGYLSANFGEGYRAVDAQHMVPMPLASSTVNRVAEHRFLLPPGSRVGRPLPRPRQILNSVERGAMERDMPMSSFGAAAFGNPFIFGEPARSMGITCNSCHEKSGNNPDFFVPGLSIRAGGMDVSNSFFAPHANNATFDPIDIPDLRGIRFTAPYGRNGRFASLREFTRNVIVNEFNGDEPDPVLLDAMVIYMDEFDFVRNPSLNPDGTLSARASDAARRGEKIFNRPFSEMGGSSCATCHVPNANFLDHRRHDIGTVAGYDNFSLDRAMDTPTLLGTMSSAPYFHDGSQPTLRAVVEWFNRRFGLDLTEPEIADLTSYVSTVGNGIHVFEAGDYFLEDDLEDMEAFITAAESLHAKKKWELLELYYRGLGFEMRRAAGEARESAHRPILEELGRLLDAAGKAASAHDLHGVTTATDAWRALYRRHRYELR